MLVSFIRINPTTIIRVFCFLFCILFTTVLFMEPSAAQPDNSFNMNKTPDEIVSQMRERLHLTDEQATKIRPVIEESSSKRHEILNSSNGDGKATKSALQQVQWTTDIRLGQILTKEQMEEYQKHRAEQSDKTQSNDTHRGRGGGHSGGMRGL